jgi:hypothetical protein
MPVLLMEKDYDAQSRQATAAAVGRERAHQNSQVIDIQPVTACGWPQEMGN